MKVYGLLYSLGLCLLVVGTTTPQSGRTSSLVMTPKQRAAYQQRRAAGSEQLRQQMGFDVSIDAALENPTTWARDFITVYEMPNWENQYTSAQIDQFAANISSALTEIANLRQNNDLTRQNLAGVVDNLQVPKRIKQQFNQTIVKPLRLELARGTAVRAGMGAGTASESAAESAERARLASLDTERSSKAAADALAAEKATLPEVSLIKTTPVEEETPVVKTPSRWGGSPIITTPVEEEEEETPAVRMVLPQDSTTAKYRALAQNQLVKDASAQTGPWFPGVQSLLGYADAPIAKASKEIAEAIQKIAKSNDPKEIAAYKNDIWKAGRGMNAAWNEETLEKQFASADEKETALDAIIARYVTKRPAPKTAIEKQTEQRYSKLQAAIEYYLAAYDKVFYGGNIKKALNATDRRIRQSIEALKAVLNKPVFTQTEEEKALIKVFQQFNAFGDIPKPITNLRLEVRDQIYGAIDYLNNLLDRPVTLWSTTESMGTPEERTWEDFKRDASEVGNRISSTASGIASSMPTRESLQERASDIASSMPTRESLQEHASGFAAGVRTWLPGSSSSSAAPVTPQAEAGFSPEQQYERAVSGPAMEDVDESVRIRTQEPESSAVSSRSRSEQAGVTSGQSRSVADFPFQASGSEL